MNKNYNQQYQKNMQRLEEYSQIRWDDENFFEVDSNVINNAKMILQNLDHQPTVLPLLTMRGTIQLVYEKPDGSYLEFEVYADYINCMVVPQRKYADAAYTDISVKDLQDKGIMKIRKIVEDFFRKD